jgi:uncharacterized protein (TIGR02466 family)
MGLRASFEPADAAALYRTGEDRHRLGDLAGALTAYDAALALEPLHGAALRLSAMALFQQGDPEAALARLEPAMAARAEDAETLGSGLWGARGAILAALSRPEEAIEAFRRALALAPEDGALWFDLGQALRDLGRLDEAITAFQAARRLDSADVYHQLGVTEQMAGRPDDALLSYRAALALDPRHAPSLTNMAALAQDAGDHTLAVALCRDAIAIDPANADAHNNLGVTLQRLGDVAGAQGAYRVALAADPLNSRALANLTELLFGEDRGAEALAQHLDAAAARPDDPQVWLALAGALERDDDLAAAAEAASQAARLDDRLWRPHHRLGEIRQRLGEPGAAIAHHQRACALAPDQAETWRQLALAAVRAGDSETALTALTPLLRLDPFDPQAWAARALALRLAGRAAEADEMTSREDLVAVLPLPAPAGYASLAAFHDDLRADLAAVRLRAWSPRGQSVVNGFQTQNDLFAEPGAAIQALGVLLDQSVAAFLEAPDPPIRRFIPTAPTGRRYRSWSINLAAGGHHAFHIHPEGSLSGVYYVSTPEGADQGGLAFGQPGFDVPLAAAPPTRVIQPRPGNLVLFPSYLWHGTEGFSGSGERITVAFDLLR